MKIIFGVLLALALTATISCRHHVDVTYNETDDHYTMKANFDERKTRAVEKYLDDRVGSQSNMSFTNTRIDGQLELDDHTTFYIKKRAGFLKIDFDKRKNSYAAYEKIKSMCQGILEIINR